MEIAYFLASIYSIVLLFFAVGLFRREKIPSNSTSKARKFPFVSVIVVARNEAENIEHCLEGLLRQSYDNYELIWIDDHSTDGSFQLAEKYQSENRNMILLRSPIGEKSALSGKQLALKFGIDRSRGEIILTTDADCTVPPTWADKIVRQFHDENVGMVVGFSILASNSPARSPLKKLFLNFQAMELLAIFSLYGAALKRGIAFACTGNNLAYRKKTYLEVGGFEAIGDTVAEDNLLLQAVDRRTNWRIIPSYTSGSIVKSQPKETIKEFIAQRIRWGSNNLENRKSVIALMIVIYFFYASLAFITFVVLLGKTEYLTELAIMWTLKTVPEFVLVARSFHLFKRLDLLLFFPFVQIFQILYILSVVPLGMFGEVKWKNRSR